MYARSGAETAADHSNCADQCWYPTGRVVDSNTYSSSRSHVRHSTTPR